MSPSSRRAWIEIPSDGLPSPIVFVALLAEGVDRNYILAANESGGQRRPPRGGRG